METAEKLPISSASLFTQMDALLERLESASEPLTLSVQEQRGLARLLEQVVARLDRAEAVEGIRRGLEQSALGLGRNAPEVFAELRRKHEIPTIP